MNFIVVLEPAAERLGSQHPADRQPSIIAFEGLPAVGIRAIGRPARGRPFCRFLVGHVGDDASNAQSLFIRLEWNTWRCLKRRPDRACSPIVGALHSRWTENFEDFFKCSTQLALRLDLIRGFTPLIRKLDRIGVSPGANPDLHRGYHARA